MLLNREGNPTAIIKALLGPFKISLEQQYLLFILGVAAITLSLQELDILKAINAYDMINKFNDLFGELSEFRNQFLAELSWFSHFSVLEISRAAAPARKWKGTSAVQATLLPGSSSLFFFCIPDAPQSPFALISHLRLGRGLGISRVAERTANKQIRGVLLTSCSGQVWFSFEFPLFPTHSLRSFLLFLPRLPQVSGSLSQRMSGLCFEKGTNWGYNLKESWESLVSYLKRVLYHNRFICNIFTKIVIHFHHPM